MKSRFIYPIILLALLAILVICGNIFFRYSPVEYKEPVEEDCAKKALKEADDEIEFAEEPVDVIPEEEEAEAEAEAEEEAEE